LISPSTFTNITELYFKSKSFLKCSFSVSSIFKPIKVKSIEKHEQIIDDKLTEVRLQYVDLIFSKKIPPLENKIYPGTDSEKDLPIDDFRFLIERYTPVLQELASFYIKQKKSEGVEWKPEMYDPLVSEFQNKIIKFHQEDPKSWIEKTMELLQEGRKKIKDIKKEDENREITDSVTESVVKTAHDIDARAIIALQRLAIRLA